MLRSFSRVTVEIWMTRRVTFVSGTGRKRSPFSATSAFERHAVGERGAHDGVFVEPDRRLQRAADEQHGEKPGQHRAGKPAQADAAAVGRSVGNVARVEGILVAEVDDRPLEALSLESCQTPVPRARSTL